MNNFELAVKAREIATKYKTLYVLGGVGRPLNEANKKFSINQYAYNAKPARKKMIEAATADTFAFDCCGLIKGGCLWGWNGDVNQVLGGAKYEANGVPDVGADAMIAASKGVSTDFSKIEIGEAVWKTGHIGVYIGGGLAVEASPAWANKVQITAVGNIGEVKGYQKRMWTKHGRLPWVKYCPMGDVNFDGKVTSADARLALRAVVKLEKLTPAQLLAADLDGDGKVSSSDARAILQKAVKQA